MFGMGDESWRARLEAAIERDGRSMRDVSLAAGLSAGYVHGILKDGKEPTLDRFLRIARALHVSAAYLLIGADVSPEAEEIMTALDRYPGRRAAILALLSEAQT